jgi:hypothetical protein
MSITTTDEQRRIAWFEFSQTPEYKALQPTAENSRMLDREVRDGNAEYSCAALLQASRTLAALLDWKPSAPSKPAPAEGVVQPEPEPDETTVPGFPVKGGIESGYAYACRVQNWRETRARAAFRERENRRIAALPPAQSTINRTNAELRLRRIEQEHWNQKKSNQS